MKKRKIKSTPPDPPFGLDIPFDEALRRFIETDPAEVEANIRRSKKKKPPGAKIKAAPSGSKDQKSVVSLRAVRMRKRNYGR
jgi:hypothetical protein